MSGGWRTMHLSEVEGFGQPDSRGWLPVRHRLGVRAFGVNAWVGESAGAEVIEEHDELSGGADSHEELYLVIDGHATFTLDGQELDAPRGTFVFVEDPAVTRKAVARETGTTVLAIGATPGVAFDVAPWERRHIEASSM